MKTLAASIAYDDAAADLALALGALRRAEAASQRDDAGKDAYEMERGAAREVARLEDLCERLAA